MSDNEDDLTVDDVREAFAFEMRRIDRSLAKEAGTPPSGKGMLTYEAEFDAWLAKRDREVLVANYNALSDKYAGFAQSAEGAITRGAFRTFATLLAEEALHLTREATK